MSRVKFPPEVIAAAKFLGRDQLRVNHLIDSMDKDLQNLERRGEMLPRDMEVAVITTKLVGVPTSHLAYMLAEMITRQVESRRDVSWAPPLESED